MRRLVLLVVGFAAVPASFGQSGMTTAVVRQPSVEVRGGKSAIFPVTGLLRMGQPVQILREEGDFFAIAPPSGSTSWVMDRGLSVYPANGGRRGYAIVKLDELPVLLGSPDSREPLPIETSKLQRGTIVFLTGEKAQYDRNEYWRIEPVAGEVRYISREATTPPNPNAAVVVSSSGSPPKLPAGASPLWLEAEEAERFGNYNRAEMLYRQLASQMSQPGGDHNQARLAYARLDALARRGNPALLPTGQPASPGQTTDSLRPGATGGLVNTGPGWVRRTSFRVDSNPVYALEDYQGRMRYYLLSQPGLNLEQFLNRYVDITGPMVARSDLAGGGYVAVTKLQLLR